MKSHPSRKTAVVGVVLCVPKSSSCRELSSTQVRPRAQAPVEWKVGHGAGCSR